MKSESSLQLVTFSEPPWHLLEVESIFDEPKQDFLHVWRIPLDSASADQTKLKSLLSLDESKRLHQFAFERLKRNFVIRRAVRRKIISQYANARPGDLKFEAMSNGKPQLSSNSKGVRFSTSHSEDSALVCMSNSPVGIDIELNRPLSDLERVSRECLSPQELSMWTRLSTSDRQSTFYEFWTCKEATLKLLGHGLSKSMQSIEVDFNSVETSHNFNVLFENQNYSGYIFKPDASYIAAVCAKRITAISFFDGAKLLE